MLSTSARGMAACPLTRLKTPPSWLLIPVLHSPHAMSHRTQYALFPRCRSLMWALSCWLRHSAALLHMPLPPYILPSTLHTVTVPTVFLPLVALRIKCNIFASKALSTLAANSLSHLTSYLSPVICCVLAAPTHSPWLRLTALVLLPLGCLPPGRHSHLLCLPVLPLFLITPSHPPLA